MEEVRGGLVVWGAVVEILQNIPTKLPHLPLLLNSCPEAFHNDIQWVAHVPGAFLEQEFCTHECDQHPSDITSCSEDRPHTPTTHHGGPSSCSHSWYHGTLIPWEAITEGWTVGAWGMLPQIGAVSFFLLGLRRCGLWGQ